jgi:integrase/recombinase XerD
VDEARHLLSIPSTEFWKPKNGKPREVPIGDVLLATLRALPRRSDRWIFPNAHGERFAEFPNKRFAAVVKAAKLQGGPHTCRHTYASHFLQAVPDLHQLAGILGHSQTRVTELYTHLLPGHLDRARNAVNLSATRKALAQTLAGTP